SGTSINIKLSELFSNSEILRYSIFDDATGIRRTTSANIGSTATTSLTGNISTKFTPKWTTNINLGLKYVFLKNKFDNLHKNQGLGGSVFIYSGYEIVKKLNVFANGGYWLNPVTLQGRTRANIWYSAGVSYRILKDKLNISLQAINFLSKYRTWYSISEDENFSAYSESQNVMRTVGLSLNWNFGKLSENVSKKRGVNNDDLKAKDQ
ncbi:MAG: outer membrane beta-barrel protein, partial [Panacibacter sp.]